MKCFFGSNTDHGMEWWHIKCVLSYLLLCYFWKGDGCVHKFSWKLQLPCKLMVAIAFWSKDVDFGADVINEIIYAHIKRIRFMKYCPFFILVYWSFFWWIRSLQNNIGKRQTASAMKQVVDDLKNRLQQGIAIESFTFVDVSQRCFKQKDLASTKQVHDIILESGMEQNQYLANNLDVGGSKMPVKYSTNL